MSQLLFKLEYTIRELRIPPEVVHGFDYGAPMNLASYSVRHRLRNKNVATMDRTHSAQHPRRLNQAGENLAYAAVGR